MPRCLYALNPSREAIFMFGDGAEVSLLKLSGRKATTRQAAWEATRITLFGATNFVIDKVTIDGSAAAGIQTAKSTNNGHITNNTDQEHAGRLDPHDRQGQLHHAGEQPHRELR